MEVEKQYARIEPRLKQHTTYHKGIRAIIARTGKNHHGSRGAPMCHNLTRDSLGDTADKLLRAHPLLFDGDTVDLAYIFSAKYLHTSAIFPGIHFIPRKNTKQFRHSLQIAINLYENRYFHVYPQQKWSVSPSSHSIPRSHSSNVA